MIFRIPVFYGDRTKEPIQFYKNALKTLKMIDICSYDFIFKGVFGENHKPVQDLPLDVTSEIEDYIIIDQGIDYCN